MNWEPIETAPRNTCVLVFDGSVGEAIWKYWEWDDEPDDDEGWWWANTDSEYGHVIYPTHWMHLPPPPSSAIE